MTEEKMIRICVDIDKAMIETLGGKEEVQTIMIQAINNAIIDYNNLDINKTILKDWIIKYRGKIRPGFSML